VTTSTERAILAGGCFLGCAGLVRRIGRDFTRVGYSGGTCARHVSQSLGRTLKRSRIIFNRAS